LLRTPRNCGVRRDDNTGRLCLRLNNSLIHGNEHDGLHVGSASIVNCTIHGNGRAGVRVFSSVTLANSLVTGNGSYGIAPDGPLGDPQVVFTDSIIWGNRSGALPPPYSPVPVGSDPQYTDSLGPDALPGTGDEDFSLRATSPAIDAGENGLVARNIDLAGMPRYVDAPSIPDRGEGTAPVIDIGAYEFQPPVRFTMLQPAADGTMMLSFNTILVRSMQLKCPRIYAIGTCCPARWTVRALL